MKERWRLCLCFLFTLYIGPRCNKSFALFEAVSDCTCSFRGSVYFFSGSIHGFSTTTTRQPR